MGSRGKCNIRRRKSNSGTHAHGETLLYDCTCSSLSLNVQELKQLMRQHLRLQTSKLQWLESRIWPGKEGHSQCINQPRVRVAVRWSLMATRTFWHRAKVGEGTYNISLPSSIVHPASLNPVIHQWVNIVGSFNVQRSEIAYVYNSFIQVHWSMRLLQPNTLGSVEAN